MMKKNGDMVLGPVKGHSATSLSNAAYVTCFGAGKPRHEVRLLLEEHGARFTTLIFPDVTTASSLASSRNSLFLGACSISNNVAMGNDVLVQGFAIVGHDVEVGDGCTISNHAFVGGRVKLGRFCTIHPHAVVLPQVEIGEGAVVGAGSVVIKNVPAHATVFGSPAKIIVQRNAHE